MNATIDNNTKLQHRIYSSECDLLFKYLVRTCRPGWRMLLKLIISAWHWLTFSIAPYLPHVDISHSGLLFSRKRWIKIFDISGSDGRSQGSHQSQVSTSSVRNQGGESCRICCRVQICVYIPHSVSSSSRKGNKEITNITFWNCTFCTCTFYFRTHFNKASAC